MALFMLDCDFATSAADRIESTAREFEHVQGSVNSYDTSCEDGFDFASAKTAIASNIEACSVKASNASKLVSAVVSAHTDLQNKLIYGKKEDSEQKKKSTGGSNPSGGRRSSGGHSGGGRGSGSGGSSDYSSFIPLRNPNQVLGDILTKVNKITCTAVDKNKLTAEERKLFNNIDFKYNDDGYAMIGNRYVISCDSSFGKVGEAVTFIKNDGKKVECIIGHVTTDEASKNTVNFYVDPNKWKASNKNNVTVNLAKDIKSVVNTGKVKIRDVAKPTPDLKDGKKDSNNANNNENTNSNSTDNASNKGTGADSSNTSNSSNTDSNNTDKTTKDGTSTESSNTSNSSSTNSNSTNEGASTESANTSNSSSTDSNNTDNVSNAGSSSTEDNSNVGKMGTDETKIVNPISEKINNIDATINGESSSSNDDSSTDSNKNIDDDGVDDNV